MAYDALDSLLIMALMTTNINGTKEFKSAVKKFSRKCTKSVQAGIMNDIISASKPKAGVFYHAETFLDLCDSASEISKGGGVGMVIVKDVAYGVDIQMLSAQLRMEDEGNIKPIEHYNAEFKNDRAWVLQNEYEMQLGAAHAVMNMLNLPRLKCDVIMFSNRGFTGVRMPLEIERGVDRKIQLNMMAAAANLAVSEATTKLQRTQVRNLTR